MCKTIVKLDTLDFELKLNYPFYFLIFCLLAGAAYAFITYYKSYYTVNGHFFSHPNILMAVFRFLTVSLISFLLLSPFIKDYFNRVEDPTVVFALDNSESVILNDDSTYYKTKFKNSINNLNENLKDNYNVKTFTFGETVKESKDLDFSSQKTNLSSIFDEIYNRYYNRNLGAIVLASDGIYNEGQNPLASSKKLKSPIYSIAMGDTIPPKDLKIGNLNYNKIVFEGNRFPVEVTINGEDCKGNESQVQIIKDGEVKFEQDFSINQEQFEKTFRAELNAKEAGLQRYVVKIKGVDNEISYVNNEKSFLINVLESKKEILLLSNAPHPDISVLKKSIENNEHYHVNTYQAKQYKNRLSRKDESLEAYNVVIFHQVPGTKSQGSQLVKQVLQEQIPTFFVLGPQSNLDLFNSLSTGLQIQQSNKSSNEVTAEPAKGFSLFTLSKQLQDYISEYPPLMAPYGDYKFNFNNANLLNQKIGKVASNKPLWTFVQRPEHKIGVLAGTGIWRWHLSEYSNFQTQDRFNELINKTIQYLSVKADKRLFRLRDPKSEFYEDEKVTFKAELYNKAYEPVEDGTITMEITNEEGKTYNFKFRKIANGYQVDGGYLPVGKYTFEATAQVKNNNYSLNGEFVVNPIDIEHLQTVADHQLLYTLANENGGAMLYPRNIKGLEEVLNNREEIKPIAHQEYKLRELINNKLLFFIIVVLLGGEWFFRKFFGGY